MNQTAVAIVGASGYGARELFRLLARHPGVKLAAAVSREADRPTVAELHRSLLGIVDLRCEPFDAANLAERIKCAFLSLPHGAAASAAAPLLERGVRVIDLSADYRLKDAAIHAQWYGESHHDAANLDHAVYGLSELFPDEIAKAKLVANPGCYPTSAILGLAPLLAGNFIEPTGIIIDSKSGVSGAGRTPKLTYHFPECNESLSAYNVGSHRHTPEIEQALTEVAGQPVAVIFTPHLVPMDRGILSTIYAQPLQKVEASTLLEIYRDFYAQPFVQVVGTCRAPKTSPAPTAAT